MNLKILPINKMCRNNNEKLQKPRPVSMKGLTALYRGVTMSWGMQITDTEPYLFIYSNLHSYSRKPGKSLLPALYLWSWRACGTLWFLKKITGSQGPIYSALLVCFAARSLWRALRFPTMFISHPRRATHINESLCRCPAAARQPKWVKSAKAARRQPAKSIVVELMAKQRYERQLFHLVMSSQRAGMCQRMLKGISVDLCNIVVDLRLVLLIQSHSLQAPSPCDVPRSHISQ